MKELTVFPDRHGGECCGRYCARCFVCRLDRLQREGKLSVCSECGYKGGMKYPITGGPMSNIVPRPGGGEVMVPAEIVKENVRSVISKMPDLISFDPSNPDSEMLALKCAVDPGVPATARDGWRGTVCQWWVGTYDVTDEKTGEVVTLPSLVLVPEEGELVRLSGWPAIRSWGNILQAAGAERCALGISVRVARRQSGTGGRSYWIVLPNA